MGTSLTKVHNLIKPDDVESIEVDHLNDNFDSIDEKMPVVIHNSMPEGKTPKMWTGWVSTNKGAGGENKDATSATDSTGVGGLWFGRDIPEFDGLSSVFLQHQIGSGGADHIAYWTVVGVNTTRIKFQGRRRSDLYANGYGSVAFYVTVYGW